MTVKFIAEVSSNHNRDLSRCLQFIDSAAEVGCDAIKFQLFKIDQLFSPEVLKASAEHRSRKAWELPLEFIPILSEKAHERGLEFGCTPFYLDAVAELQPFVDFYKVASYELLWLKLIETCAKTQKPVILSTGMATLEEVEQAAVAYRSAGGKDLTLLHCVSHYPTTIDECNLAAIKLMRDKLSCAVGWSDHSVEPAVITRAVNKWEASCIEFHLDIEGAGAEYSAGHCWLPSKIGELIRSIRQAVLADGLSMKAPVSSELMERLWRADPSDGLRPLLTKRKEVSC